MTESKPLTIGQLAAAVGKTPRALRLYEQLGLICPEARSEGGFRLYGETSRARLESILELAEMGVSLADVQCLLDHVHSAPDGKASMSGLRGRFEARLRDLDGQIQRLGQLRDALRASLQWLARCDSCEFGPVPMCCQRCISETGDVPDVLSGLLAQPCPHTKNAKDEGQSK